MDTSKFTTLLSPGRIGGLELKNRIIYPPLQNRMADENHLATPRMAEYFAERARGGIGLITVQHSMCWPEARLVGGLGLWDDGCIPALASLAAAVHAAGAKIAIQLGGRGTRQDNGAGSVAPSAIRLSYEKDIPRELAIDQLAYFTRSYGQAARRARTAGFDAIEIHGAHGKLISQFLSPYTNRRTDAYGGNAENRTRFPRDIIAAVRAQVGPDFPIIFRLSVTDKFEGGLTLDQGLEEIGLLELAGADAFHVSGGSQEFVWNTDHSYFFPLASQVDLAAAVKKVTDKPVIAVSKIADPFLAESILARGQADFVAMGRPFLADPMLLRKSLAGEPGRIRRCIYCLNCTTWNKRPALKNRSFACTVNPAVGREAQFVIVKTAAPKNVMVIGGGLAGMEAARVLAERGHRPSLYEAAAHLGGQWRVASHAEEKRDFKTLIPWFAGELKALGVPVHLGVRVDVDMVKSLAPDAVVIATGATPRDLPVERPEHGGPEVVQANDVIMDRAVAGRRVVVVGGRYIGMEAATKLAREGRHVSLVEACELGQGTIQRLRGVYRNHLVESGVFIFDHSPVMRLTTRGVDVANNGSMLSLPCDTVVLAVGTCPVNELIEPLRGLGLECHAIGDCKGIGDALVAISDGAEVGRLL